MTKEINDRPSMTTNEERLKCCILGCFKSPKKNDVYCSMHRARWSRTRRFDKITTIDKMMLKTKKIEGGCWIYNGFRNVWGYGRIKSNGENTLTHRLSYIHHNGEIPKGMLVCHKCDNPSCINPMHLFLGSNTDNIRDSIKKGRRDPVKIAKERWIKCPTWKKK